MDFRPAIGCQPLSNPPPKRSLHRHPFARIDFLGIALLFKWIRAIDVMTAESGTKEKRL
jgi:hypothetical protein